MCFYIVDGLAHQEDAFTISIVMRTGVDVPAAFDILFRVELRSSLSAPAEVYCPETSVWQPREELVGHVSSTAQGLPRYTVCVQEPRATTPADYLSSASQHISAVPCLPCVSYTRPTTQRSHQVNTKGCARVTQICFQFSRRDKRTKPRMCKIVKQLFQCPWSTSS